jgi:hypothetical protein
MFSICLKTILTLFLLGLLHTGNPPLLKDSLPINRIQIIGSHNSYKQAIDPLLFKLFYQRDSAQARSLEYAHIGLAEQLDMGLRNLEIDVYSDSLGGRYAHPKGLEWAPGQAPYDPARQMDKPGFKVLHVPDLDFRSSAATLTDALTQLRQWSEAHPTHSIVFITLEVKDSGIGVPGSTQVEKITPHTLDELDRVIQTTLGVKHLLTPDQVRGKSKTLEEAVLGGRWPTVKDTQGKFAFILDDRGNKREMYIQDHSSLRGRVLFVNAEPGTPEAAMLIRNNPKDPQIPQLVSKGYIIRTRADSGTQQARTNDRSDFEAASASGAQIITTDYYRKSDLFPSEYQIRFPEGGYSRTNPLLAK